MTHVDAERHVRGESLFIDDLPMPEGTLHAHVCASDVAHGTLISIEADAARAMAGVVAVLTAADIPGDNEIGTVVADEPLLAEGSVHFIGQPVALVVAEDAATARAAAALVVIRTEPLPVVTDPREAFRAGDLIVPPVTFELGDVDGAWADCAVVVAGTTETGGQEHLYLETQGALAVPVEGGGVKIHSSTQGPTAVQRAAAHVCGLTMQQVEVDVLRLGGGFGGKEDQATCWAVLCALAAIRCHRPVKLVLHRRDDLRMTGKRHPYSSDFRIGVTGEGRILAYEVTFFQDAGACADLSPAILDRTLFHCTNSYAIPNVRATGNSCRTNLPPNTAFRGFGGPQGMFVIEAAISAAADALGVDRSVVQRANLLQEGDQLPYGQRVERCHAEACWDALEADAPAADARARVAAFNAEHTWRKKGIAWMPICFGISFTNMMLNQASALVHVYTDGSVGVSTAAVEMGQGVNAKIAAIAARTLSVGPGRVRVESTNTKRVANTSPTAASSAADLNGRATELACGVLAQRLREVAARLLGHGDAARVELRDEQVLDAGEPSGFTWLDVVSEAYQSRTSLTAQQHYATPRIHFDRATHKGDPFAYHVFGAAQIEVTLDGLRGTYDIDAVHVVHDVGRSLDPVIDRSQAEGAIMQGIGWLTVEEVQHTPEGRLLTDSLATYKVPDAMSVPGELAVRFLEDSDNPYAPFSSKAIGEPPLMYGIGAWFALREAMRAFRPDRTYALVAPLTAERVLCALYDGVSVESPAAP